MDKSIFFVSYYFPPIGGPGALRPYFFVKNLISQGDEKIYLFCSNLDSVYGTNNSLPPIENNKLKKEKLSPDLPFVFRLMKKIKYLNKVFFFILFPIYWERQAFFAFRLFLRFFKIRENPGVIYVTTGPFSPVIASFFYAKIKSIPIIIDYRDPFSSSPGRVWFSKLHHKFFEFVERQIVLHANKIIVTSEGIAEDLFLRFGLKENKVSIIYNGFEGEPFRPEKVQSKDFFKVVYTGSLHDWDGNIINNDKHLTYRLNNHNVNSRSLFLLLNAFKSIDQNKAKFHFNFYGNHNLPFTNQMISEFKLDSDFTFHGYVNFEDLPIIYENADFLLMLQEDRVDGRGMPFFIMGKVFEYIKTGKPIIVLGQESHATNLLKKIGYPFLRIENDIQKIKTGFESLKIQEFNFDKNLYYKNIKVCMREYQANQLIDILKSAKSDQ